MRILAWLIFGLFIGGFSGYSQLYFPNENFYNSEIERYRLRADSNLTLYQSHLSMKPIMETMAIRDSVLKDNSTHYYWITQKLFKENFIVFTNATDKDKGDFWVSLDPVIDIEGGSDLAEDSLRLMYWNTRGLRVQARFKDIVAFTTSIYETQSVQPKYYSRYVKAHGEFYYSLTNNTYNQQNGVVPGYARTKLFKTDGYDYSMAQGLFVIRPNKHFNFTMGNGTHFIGNGHRSLLLSDLTTPYPFVNFRTTFLKGRVQYNVMYSTHQNLYRLRAYTTPEATYEKKIGAHQYLDVSITKNWQLGIFHGSMWNRVDSTGGVKPNYLFLNPVILSNAFINASQSGRSHISGFNTSINFDRMVFYSQLVLQEGFKMGGFQFGIKAYDILVPNLDARLEYNQVNQNTYLSDEDRMNWSSNNLPLAHPLVAGFNELIARISYRHNRFFVTNQLTYSARDRNDTYNIGTNILDNKGTISIPEGFYRNHVVMNQIELGYRFNKQNNLQIFVGHTYRNETHPILLPTSNYVFGGIRTRLNNKTQNF